MPSQCDFRQPSAGGCNCVCVRAGKQLFPTDSLAPGSFWVIQAADRGGIKGRAGTEASSPLFGQRGTSYLREHAARRGLRQLHRSHSMKLQSKQQIPQLLQAECFISKMRKQKLGAWMTWSQPAHDRAWTRAISPDSQAHALLSMS